MHTYNFETKELSHIFNSIEYVVDGRNILDCPTDEAKVVRMFENNRLFVAIPIKYLGRVTIGGFNSESTGYFHVGHDKVYFSIHGNILYIRCRS